MRYMNDDMKILEKQTFHWLVIKEKKNKVRDEFVLDTIANFKAGAKEFAMDNYIMFIDKLMNAYLRPLEFNILEDRINVLELQVQELSKPVETKKEPIKEKSTF